MKTLKLAAVSVAVAALAGCGLESYFSNVTHEAYQRPASRIQGALEGNSAWTAPDASGFTAIDGAGTDLKPFQRSAKSGSYEIRLPSSNYSMIRVQARNGDFLLRAVVPAIGEETTLVEDLSPETVTEALVMEARLSAEGKKFSQLTPAGYLGAREAIRAQFTVDGPTKDLLDMVGRFMEHGLPTSAQSDPSFFLVPVLNATYGVVTSAIDPNYLPRNPFDYTGDGVEDLNATAFDAKLAEVAQLYLPVGCPSTKQKWLVFTVDFNAGGQDGVCAVVNRFLWAKDKPGKSMFFVGWIHRESQVTLSDRPDINTMLGASSPNQVRMYDDGTNGDEVAGDNIWTVAFKVDIDPDKVLRVGYKYTWGTRGAPWTGSEEWPGNSRILEVVDVNGDGFVYRRDIFQDESTNKDKSNLNPKAAGTLSWDEQLIDGPLCGPESHERPWVNGTACLCGTEWFVPTALGAITEAAPIAIPQACP